VKTISQRGQSAEIIKYTRLVLWACGELTDCDTHTYIFIYSPDDRFPPRFPHSTISRAAFPICSYPRALVVGHDFVYSCVCKRVYIVVRTDLIHLLAERKSAESAN